MWLRWGDINSLSSETKMMPNKEIIKWYGRKIHFLLNSLSPKSACVFSTLFFIHSLWYCLREFVLTSQYFIFGDYFTNSHDLSVWSGSVNVGRNWMWVTIRANTIRNGKSWITSKPFKRLTRKLATFPKNYLKTFWSCHDVYVNIDVTMATELWHPCFYYYYFAFFL